MTQDEDPRSTDHLSRAALVLGIGLGGFFDGIVFHQILQWHHMISSRTPPETVSNLQLNTFFDGLFHGTTWLVTVVGLWLLLRAKGERGRSDVDRVLTGGVLAGWGLFNLTEGVADHYLLGIHHVRPGPDEALYDLAFLIWGAVFLIVGWRTMRSARFVTANPRDRAT